MWARLGLVGLFLLTACGGGEESSPGGTDPVQGGRDAGSGAFSTIEGDYVSPIRLTGKLYYRRNEPLESVQVLMADFDGGRISVVANGRTPSSWGDEVAFIEYCSPLSVRLSVVDEDGFTAPISECVEEDVITPDFFGAAISPDGDFLVVTNTALPNRDAFDDPMDALVASFDTLTATQLYSRSGELIDEYFDMGPAVFTRSGELILAGRGGEAGYGLFQVKRPGQSVPEKIDDGRISGLISDMDAHPRRDRIIFIFNSQLFEMDLGRGEPKRIHSHGVPLWSATYAPDGDQIAFISTDPLDESFNIAGPGYPIFILEDGDVQMVRFANIPGGPLDWVE